MTWLGKDRGGLKMAGDGSGRLKIANEESGEVRDIKEESGSWGRVRKYLGKGSGSPESWLETGEESGQPAKSRERFGLMIKHRGGLKMVKERFGTAGDELGGKG